jgi:hypothetical protein
LAGERRFHDTAFKACTAQCPLLNMVLLLVHSRCLLAQCTWHVAKEVVDSA